MDGKLFSRALLCGLIPAAAGAAVAWGRRPGVVFSDACFIAAVALALWGLWRVLRHTHLLDGIVPRRDAVDCPHREVLLAAFSWLMLSVLGVFF